MGIRQYQINTGPETATLPTATEPAGASDLTTKNYVDSNFEPLQGAETQQSLADGQGSTADITGLIFDSSVYRSAVIWYTNENYNAAGGTRATGELTVDFERKASAWTLEDEIKKGSHDLTWFIDVTTGQVGYQSATLGGTGPTRHLRFKVMHKFLKET